MIDQRVSEGEKISLFGKTALTTTLPAQLSIKYDLDIIGLMCLPPNVEFTEKYFKEMLDLKSSSLSELSMGMSNDYIKAINHRSTYIRIGTKIFGERK